MLEKEIVPAIFGIVEGSESTTCEKFAFQAVRLNLEGTRTLAIARFSDISGFLKSRSMDHFAKGVYSAFQRMSPVELK